MLDTVRLLVGAEPTEEQLQEYWTRMETARPGGQTQVRHHYNPDEEIATLPRLTFRPESYAGSPQISIEVSLPKLIFGNNYELLTDLAPAIEVLGAVLDADPAVPRMPEMAATALSRLDICCHYDVGDDLPHYIDTLARLEYPRRTTIRFNAETVEFRANSVKSKFYDKHAETEGACPPGILRHEITYHRARSIKTAFDTKRSVKLADVTIDSATELLTTDLKRLGIHEKPFATHALAIDRLCDEYGTTTGPRLYGVLCVYQHLGRGATAERIGVKRNAVSRLLAQVRKAGIATALTHGSSELPPLQVSFSENPKTCTQTPGVTQGSLASGEVIDQ